MDYKEDHMVLPPVPSSEDYASDPEVGAHAVDVHVGRVALSAWQRAGTACTL